MISKEYAFNNSQTTGLVKRIHDAVGQKNFATRQNPIRAIVGDSGAGGDKKAKQKNPAQFYGPQRETEPYQTNGLRPD